MNTIDEGKVKSLDDGRFGNNGGVGVVKGGINRVALRKGISRGHLGTRQHPPDNIKVL